MARLQWLIDQSRWQFPLLYGDDQYTIWRILNQLFFVLGNGYEWNGIGEMAYIFPPEKGKLDCEGYKAELRMFYHGRKIRRAVNQYYPSGPKKERPMLLYPVSGYSLIHTIPDDVEDDFLIAGWLLLEFAITAPLEFFLDSERDGDGTTGYSAIEQRARLVETRELYKERFGDRLKGLSWKTIYER